MQFGETAIVICATAMLPNEHLSPSEIESNNNLSARRIISIEKDFLGLPFSAISNAPINVQIVLPPLFVVLPNGNRKNATCKMQAFDDGFFLCFLEYKIDEKQTVKAINNSINDILSGNKVVMNGITYSFSGWVNTVLHFLSVQIGLSITAEQILVFKTYSVVNPKHIYPSSISAANLIGSQYEYDLYEAVVRRVTDMSETRLDISRREQDNLSIYNEDMVYLNYHHLFVYVTPVATHIPYDIYNIMVGHYKIYIAKLKYILNDVSRHLVGMRDISSNLKVLQQESDWIEAIRLRQLRALEQFNKSVDMASTRMAWFRSAANRKFRIENLTSRLNEALNNYEDTITRRVSLKQDRSLQKLSTWLTILSIIISIVGILIAVPFPKSDDRKPTHTSTAVQSNIVDTTAPTIFIDTDKPSANKQFQ